MEVNSLASELNTPSQAQPVTSAEQPKHLQKLYGQNETRFSKMASEEEKDREFKISEGDIQKTIDRANKVVEPLFLEFQYKIHEKTNQVMISVINSNTKELVREIPPEKVLDAVAKMWELTGILVDQRG